MKDNNTNTNDPKDQTDPKKSKRSKSNNNPGRTRKPRKPRKGQTPNNPVNPGSDLKDKQDDGMKKMARLAAWYTLSETTTKSVANLAFNIMTGRKLPWDITDTNSSPADDQDKVEFTNDVLSLPGVMAINVSTTVGDSRGPTSAVNIAAKAVYQWVRHENAGRANYDPADLMIYIAAMADIYSLYYHIRKLLAIANEYHTENRYFPDGVLVACGIDPSSVPDVKKNYSLYIGRLSLLAKKLNAYPVPKNYNLFLHRTYLFSTIFGDSDSIRGQFYVFNPRHLHKFIETAGPGKLEEFSVDDATDLSGLIDELEVLTSAVIESEDMGIIAGDILKAYKDQELVILDQVTFEEKSLVVFDQTILNMIENSTSNFGGILTGDITQDEKGNILQFSEGFTPSNQVCFNGKQLPSAPLALFRKLMLNCHKIDPSPEEILETTRLQCGFYIDENDGKYYFTCGTEYIEDYSVVRYNYDSMGNPMGLGSYVYNQYKKFGPTISPSSIVADLTQITGFEKFDWHPFTYVFAVADDPSNNIFTFINAVGDVKLATLLDVSSQLHPMHDMANMALFAGGRLQR